MRLRAALIACAAVLIGAPAALAGTANGGLPGATPNPLAGMQWGHYTGAYDGVYSVYEGSSGTTRQLLGKIALRPTAHWFGQWVANSRARDSASSYIDQVTGGDPDVLTQFAVFRFDPWESCSAVAGTSGERSYRAWVDAFAAGIGDSRALIVLQPDLPFAMCSSGRAQWLRMAAYAAKKFNGLRHTTVYVDGGAYQWISVRSTVSMLERAGIRHARGLALNTTEFDTTARELGWGAQIIQALAADGIRDKHMVISTSQNGAGFLNGQYPGNVADPRACRSRSDHLCVSLGIPPTTDVANPKWELGRTASGLAARYADAYIWVGRPWLVGPSSSFDLRRALGIVRSSPF